MKFKNLRKIIEYLTAVMIQKDFLKSCTKIAHHEEKC